MALPPISHIDERPPPRVRRPLAVADRPTGPNRQPVADRTVLRWGVAPFLLLSDLAACTVSLLVIGGAHWRLDALFVLLTAGVIAGGRHYRPRLCLSALDDAASLTGRVLATVAATMCVALLVGYEPDTRLLAAGGVAAGLVVTSRAALYAVVRYARRRGWVTHRTLILGAGRVGGTLASALSAHGAYGLTPVGFLDDDPLLTPDERPVPLLGGVVDLPAVLAQYDIRDVIIAFGAVPGSQMVDIIRTCDRLEVEIFFVPRLFELHHASADVDHVWGIPLVRLRRSAFRSPTWRLKRFVDITFAATALVLLSPLLAACALAVRLESGPGVLFRQERIGLDGRAFHLLKFRSLRPSDDGESSTRWSIAEDDRVGPVGRFLRRTSFDELPQLWNILRGDMTLVGPRPERPHFVTLFARDFPGYPDRHRTPAGLTGLAQVHGLRGDTSIADRARFDNYYIENWSLWGDVKILARTLSAVLRRAGA